MPKERLRNPSGSGIPFLDLDAVRLDPAILEGVLLRGRAEERLPLLPHKLARILAKSPTPCHHLEKLVHFLNSEPKWEGRLDPILAGPESEAWRLIDDHFSGQRSSMKTLTPVETQRNMSS